VRRPEGRDAARAHVAEAVAAGVVFSGVSVATSAGDPGGGPLDLRHPDDGYSYALRLRDDPVASPGGAASLASLGFASPPSAERPRRPPPWLSLDRLLDDVAKLLAGDAARLEGTKAHVAELRALRARESIPSLGDALVASLPRVVGLDVWCQAVELQRGDRETTPASRRGAGRPAGAEEGDLESLKRRILPPAAATPEAPPRPAPPRPAPRSPEGAAPPEAPPPALRPPRSCLKRPRDGTFVGDPHGLLERLEGDGWFPVVEAGAGWPPRAVAKTVTRTLVEALEEFPEFREPKRKRVTWDVPSPCLECKKRDNVLLKSRRARARSAPDRRLVDQPPGRGARARPATPPPRAAPPRRRAAPDVGGRPSAAAALAPSPACDLPPSPEADDAATDTESTDDDDDDDDDDDAWTGSGPEPRDDCPTADLLRKLAPAIQARVMQDVVDHLAEPTRADFHRLHLHLDAQKRRGAIDSVSYHLFRQGPKLTGLQVWRQALDRHVKQSEPPAPDDAAGCVTPPSSPLRRTVTSPFFG